MGGMEVVTAGQEAGVVVEMAAEEMVAVAKAAVSAEAVCWAEETAKASQTALPHSRRLPAMNLVVEASYTSSWVHLYKTQ